ncbi:hypothetical protein IC229_30200 [Spirosoma sp. BT702]|uniref:Uncharacterized protein n=1 Tax=Spirosoma profusum TaxID=2771354 RepID=A0A927AV22_9BACT|nr:hypothetical protein [Spirosoma profusum]MBD2704942.1 hypothetical protein [Spirosoma profusum]
MQLSIFASVVTEQTLDPSATAESWIKFVRQYGPIPRNDSAFEEHINKASRRAGVMPIRFQHPLLTDVLSCFNLTEEVRSVVLTGHAGDGKTNLCHRVWQGLGGDPALSDSSAPYIRHQLPNGLMLHVIRDLSAWVPSQGSEWEPEKVDLLTRFSESIHSQNPTEYFLIAGNDGQLIETWKRLPENLAIQKTRLLFEDLLVEDRQQSDGVQLSFFNLSRSSSAVLFDSCITAFLSHPGWQLCFNEGNDTRIEYNEYSPIYINYKRLQDSLLQSRLRKLFELCDYNDIHIPIREILALLANAILGHPKVTDRLMLPTDVRTIIHDRLVPQASIYDNIFGINLTDSRRDSIGVFSALSRFRIGEETSNRIDNLLIYGNTDETLTPYFTKYLANDPIYGASEAYLREQSIYIEGVDDDDRSKGFLPMLASQRRALFFKIAEEEVLELKLWHLTVFSYAGEYLEKVIKPLKTKKVPVERDIVGRLVRGINRVFVGMLVNSDRELFLGSSLHASGARVCRVFEDNISVRPKNGQSVKVDWYNNRPILNVSLSNNHLESLTLNLVRYEFLSRVAEGALPSSFSKECYEDVMSFKSKLLKRLTLRRQEDGSVEEEQHVFQRMVLDDNGNPIPREINFTMPD